MASLNYRPAHVIGLFDEMAQTYGAVNLLSSLGFSHLWRKACIKALDPGKDDAFADLMCGMGEATTLLKQDTGPGIKLDAIDFCPSMARRCARSVERHGMTAVSVKTQNVFDLPTAPSYDRIVCSFGLKTFDDEQLRRFAKLIKALLRPGGRASFVEIHVPENQFLRVGFLIYLRHFIPTMGRLCLGNPDCYKHLALYTEDFARRDFFDDYLREAGLTVTTRPLFFGCAKLYVADGI